MGSFGKSNANVNSALVIQASQGGSVTNTGFGTGALSANSGANNNTAFGNQALPANISGIYNSAFGAQTAVAQTTAVGTSAFGYGALNQGNGSYNSAFGFEAMLGTVTTTGQFNSAFGSVALNAITTGSYDCAFGNNTLYLTTTGNNNSAFGNEAMGGNTSGSNNCAFGMNTLTNMLTGSNNTILGFQAGNAYTGAESNNIIVGSQATFAADSGTIGESNVTRIGPVVARNNQQVGQGWSGIYAAYNSGSQNGALTAQGSYTPPAVAGTYRVMVTVYCTVGTTTTFSVKVNYKDLNGTAHADIFPLASAAAPGVFLTNGLVITAGTYYSLPFLISVDNSQTPITFSTVGTFTTVTYFLNATTEQVI